MRKFTNRIEYSNFGSYTSKFCLNQNGLNDVLTYMFDPSFWEKISQSITNFDNNAVISLYVLPVSLFPIIYKRYRDELDATVYFASYIKVLDNQIPIDNSGGNSLAYYIDPRIFNKAIYGGSCYISKQFDSSGIAPEYLDYSPYTKIQVNIPFIGLVDVETNLVMGRYIDFWYTIDLATMELTAYLYSRSVSFTPTIDNFNTDTDDNFLVAKFSAPYGSQIALNGENRGQMMQQTLSSFGSVIGDVATLPMTGGMSAIKLAGDINSTLHPAKSFNAGVSGAGYNAFFDNENPQVLITRPVLNNTVTNTNARVNGYAVETATYSGGLKAFINGYKRVASNVPEYYKFAETNYLEGVAGATGDEISELNSLLRAGIYYKEPETETENIN